MTCLKLSKHWNAGHLKDLGYTSSVYTEDHHYAVGMECWTHVRCWMYRLENAKDSKRQGSQNGVFKV